jgi:uncharacterized tellurite resistance protein B-like protein
LNAEDQNYLSDDLLRVKLNVQLAVSCLLLSLARADNEITDKENKKIFEMLNDLFGMSEEELQPILKKGNEVLDLNPGLSFFTEFLNQKLNADERFVIVRVLWQVAQADDDADKYEEHEVRNIAVLFKIPYDKLVASNIVSKVQFVEDILREDGSSGGYVNRPLATAILFMELVKSDGKIDPQEIEAGKAHLVHLFEIDEGAAAENMSKAEKLVTQSGGLHAFTSFLNENMDDQDKFQLIQGLWKIAKADGEIDRYEEFDISEIASLLMVPKESVEKAKTA